MTGLAIEKQPSKLPKVALTLGIIFLIISALEYFVPSIYWNFIHEDMGFISWEDPKWDLYRYEEESTQSYLSIFGGLCALASSVCILILFIYNALDKKSRSSIAAPIICGIPLLSAVCAFLYIAADLLSFLSDWKHHISTHSCNDHYHYGLDIYEAQALLLLIKIILPIQRFGWMTLFIQAEGQLK